MAGNNSTSQSQIIKISQHERFERVSASGLLLTSQWLTEAGFSLGMPVKLRIMPGCVVITAQNIRELWQCLEGLSLEPFNPEAAAHWINDYPGGLVTDC